MINKIIIDNKNKDTYKVLMKININDKDYIIYTKDEKNKLEDKICYVGEYNFTSKTQKILPVDDISLENIDQIFRQIIMLINKKESSDNSENK